MNDVSGRSGRAARTSAKFKLPPLSPAFLTEEDAAYWAHTRIARKSDKEYGSVILLRPDGKFVVTSPIAGEPTRFDFGSLLEIDAAGMMLHPLGYRCVASLHSHPPLHDEFRKDNPRQDERLVRLFISFFSAADFIGDVTARDFFRSAYLSGADGTLLKYVSSGSPEERDYYLWHQSGAPSGHPSGAYELMSLINKLATVGELKVIVSSADWGHSVGQVPAAWKAGAPFSAGVITELPLMTRVCVNAERAVLAALKSRGAQTTGLLLKKRGAEEYVATHARPAGLDAWDPEKIFPLEASGQLRLPAGYALEGFYFASRPDPTQFPPVQPWLYENFFTPQEMALAIAARARSQRWLAASRPLSLFMQATDYAMLQYQFSGSPVEAALSVEQADGTIGDNGVQSRLLADTLRPRMFVSMLVLAGRLNVVRGSALWAQLGPVDLQWQPFAHFPWPVLSRDFLSADDAARHAHEQIGIRRDRQYAGYVFQRSDKRFVVTEPREGDIDTLSQGRLYPLDNHGQTIFPDDHRLQARYVSHVALSRLDPVHVGYHRWTPREALLSLQMLNVEEVRQALADTLVLYCSGGRDSLIRYTPSVTLAAKDLATRLGTRQHPGTLARDLDAGSKRPQAFVREQAAAGELVSLIDDALWGYRGPIVAGWAFAELPLPASTEPPPRELPGPPLSQPDLPPYPELTPPGPTSPAPLPWKRPVHLLYGALFASADEAAQSQYARDTRLQDDKRAWFGFILKHREREEFIATELIPVSERRDNLFDLDSVFASMTTEPWYRYPEGFDLFASFYSHQRVKDLSERPADWLAHYFITPDDLTVAMYYSPRRPLVASDLPAALYIANREGALLKYRRSATSKLFHDNTSQATLDSIKRDLLSGAKVATDFVHVVASSGELSVIRTSECWDRPGKVKPTWQPFANLERRWLSPAFQSADDAAVYVRSLLPSASEKTWGGLILRRADALYVATLPVEVSRENFDSTEIFPDESKRAGLFPLGCKIAARYRSRVVRELSVTFSPVQKQIYLNMLSVDTVYSAFTRRFKDWDEYLFAPDGALICYYPGLWERLRADLAAALSDNTKVPANLDADAIRQRILNGELQPVAWINSLARIGYLQVVTGSEIWGSPRAVEQWTPYANDLRSAADYTQAMRDPVCSPLFLQADATARYVHEASVSRDTLTFGFVLYAREGVYLATLPLTAQRSELALDRVFPQGRWLRGYAWDALYLRAPLPPVGVRADDVRHFLFAPNDIQQACRRASTPQGYKLIYLSCADGALLKWQLHAFEPGEFYDEFGQIKLLPNSFVSPEQATVDERDMARGRFSLAGYVQRMAKAGRLEVIETSDCWSRHGQVTEDWQPQLADTPHEQRWQRHPVPALGPIFNHPDDAARYAQQRVDKETLGRTGYEGAILARSTRQRFVPLEPIAGFDNGDSLREQLFSTAKDSSSRNPALSLFDGYTCVASHQFNLSPNITLSADVEQVRGNFPAPDRMHAHTHALKNKGLNIQAYYYSTPEQVLLKYTPDYSAAENDLLLSARSLVFKDGRWVSRLSPAEFVSQLMQLGELRVLVAGRYWRQTGRMGDGWKIRRQQSSVEGTVRRKDEL
ncbi:hypothetical protein CCX46_03020 [Pseudomonas sp. RU47]|uniref:DUF4329 domain-containing protein n=1 Tax=Pseudomonas sp. RU47 TaxID=2005388 RepID=UPI000FDE0262|nr:DUF4329 domain-containing protein [Pseudomonas sp. RU47]AZZ74148.1 hypothetical protein CCX46_03020 [Pseudomonas sp. RU47]